MIWSGMNTNKGTQVPSSLRESQIYRSFSLGIADRMWSLQDRRWHLMLMCGIRRNGKGPTVARASERVIWPNSPASIKSLHRRFSNKTDDLRTKSDIPRPWESTSHVNQSVFQPKLRDRAMQVEMVTVEICINRTSHCL